METNAEAAAGWVRLAADAATKLGQAATGRPSGAATRLSHVAEDGSARMVDVSGKEPTCARQWPPDGGPDPEAADAIRAGAQGRRHHHCPDRGIQAAKRTPN